MSARLSHRRIIRELGGSGAVAGALRLPQNTVTKWLLPQRGVPAMYWLAVSELARKHGLDISPVDLARSSPVARAKRQRRRLPVTAP